MWKPQTGKIVETGIEGNGSTSDHWKYLVKELQASAIVVPVRLQGHLDSLASGKSTVVTKE